MKKILSIMLVIALLFTNGCTNRIDSKNNVTEAAKKGVIPVTTVSNASIESSGEAIINNNAGYAQLAVIDEASAESDTADVTVISETADWPTEAWSTSTPKEQGLDEKMLSKADQRITDNYTNMYSLLVIRHGYLVYEKYYNGMDENDANPVYSVTKSVMSALTGIAIEEKYIDSVNQKVSKLLPKYFKKVDNKKKKDITIKNVLTMTGGLKSVDLSWNSYHASKDWLSYAIEQPLVSNPGEKFSYNTGLTSFLSGIISKTSNVSTKEFADKYLFDKLGISIDKWESDKTGNYAGGFGLSMTPRDMAKFGYLYLNKGTWNGEQIIPEKWVEESTKEQVALSGNTKYGYLFWLDVLKDNVHKKNYNIVSASGSGGQWITMIPDLDMVVVTTTCEWKTSKDKASTMELIRDYVITAVE